LRQRQAAQAQGADLQKISARNTVTETRFLAVDRQHKTLLLQQAGIGPAPMGERHFKYLLRRSHVKRAFPKNDVARQGSDERFGPLYSCLFG
jgi:hypothetical protein